MKFRTLLATVALVSTGLVAAPSVAYAAAPGDASTQALRPCTRTSSGSCIRGGQFCPQSRYGQSGYDARGRRYVCKGSRSHPHWMIP